MATTPRPRYQTEPREDLEERVVALSQLLLKACVLADDAECGCLPCQYLRELYAEMNTVAAMPE